MVWVKICGVKDLETAVKLAELNVDALGLNFYARSPRVVSVATAAAIAEQVGRKVELVALFVNHSVMEAVQMCRSCGVQTVQVHGDEPPEWLARFRERLPEAKLIRAFRLGEEGFEPLARFLEACRRLDCVPDRCLVDAAVKGAYGGTGQTVSWEQVTRQYLREQWPPLVLAGGLTPENVAEAVRTVRPWGVDTASGVESAPGRKDVQRAAAFIQAARRAAG